jgi:natural product biosynthesis luciferase-like monooxygenase protein
MTATANASPVQCLPLTPVQQGMLYHHLAAPHTGVDIEQMVATLHERLDVASFRVVWDRLINRHGVFRTSFGWEDRPQPVQVEHSHARMSWQQEDLGRLPEEEWRRHLEDFLQRDRVRGFDFHVPPLARATLFRTGDEEWTFVWTFHHILADGQCYPTLLREAFADYAAFRDGKEFTIRQPRPFRGFLEWLGPHLEAMRPKAAAYWRDTLRGYAAAASLQGLAAEVPGVSGVEEKVLVLSATATAALADFAHAHDVTVATLVNAAWALALGAYSGSEDVVFGVTRACRRGTVSGAEEIVGSCINTLPLRVRLEPRTSVLGWLKELRAAQVVAREFEHTPLVEVQRASEVAAGTPLFETVVVFTPRLIGAALRELSGDWAHRDVRFLEQTNYPLTLFAYQEKELLLKLAFDRTRFAAGPVERCLELLKELLIALPVSAGRTLADLPSRSARDRALLERWNATNRPFAHDRCIHQLFEDQVRRTPHATALVFRDRAMTYDELNRRANRLARRLRALGVAPGQFVGIFLKRSPEMVVALWAALKAGAAYVPLDPAFPRQRLAWMLEDTRASVVLTQRDLAAALPAPSAHVLCLDEHGPADLRTEADDNLDHVAGPSDLAYVNFTSGSSGRPKGVMVEHRNVTNYFTGMDEVLGGQSAPAGVQPGTWLAVTSISFDISVQELFWTLTRGFKVVLQENEMALAVGAARPGPQRQLAFSLFYFAADAGQPGENRYRLLLEGARFADEHGFAAVWTPERHFHPFGGLYPNPSLTGAAVAAITRRVGIRAGSVVLPLHNPIRVAEEWSVVDNLSQGRVGLSFASGWHANDFALMPDNYKDRKEVLARGLETVRKLWRGEAVPAVSGTGQPITTRIFPAPVQSDPPIWMTSAGNVETFQAAGRLGVNVLTNLLGQTAEELTEKIATYRAARQQSGHAGPGHVTLMLHTFVGPDLDEVRRKVRGPFLEYLKTSTDLIKKARWEFPAFAAAANKKLGPVDDDALTEEEMQAILDHAFERYFQTSGLFGTPESCLAMTDRLKAAGVDEVACLVDFGVDTESILASLRHLNELRERSNPAAAEGDYSIPAQLRRHAVTHLQCTPSLARMLASEAESLEALRPLRKLLVGGERLPPGLAGQLALVVAGDLVNVYGPTETTVWSTAAPIDRSGGPVTIGRPLANTQVHLLDGQRRPVPVGVAGELCIGGRGVARGYLHRPELTAERFFPDPFGHQPDDRLYRTGDLARHREDGRIEFLGRLDHQVKIRGHRIELGEIEAVLASHAAVHECAVVARAQEGGDQALVAYVAAGPSGANGSAVASWQSLWDATYAGDTAAPRAGGDGALNTAGWVSSYTGQLIPDDEMRELAEHTCGRILDLKPRRVLEIGCGTGMLLLRLAPHCQHYCGVDFAASALRHVEAEVARRGLRNVELRQAAAHELSGLEPGSLDAVVLNSVIQYFPDADYLIGVLERVLPLLREGGAVFVGDVRCLPLQEAFHTSVALAQAPPGAGADEVRRQARQRRERDHELVFDPPFFRALPQRVRRISKVRTHLKRGRRANELACFRYDVVLGVGGAAEGPSPLPEPGRAVSLDQIKRRLATAAPALGFAGLLNPRVAEACRAAQLLASDACPGTAAEIRQAATAAAVGGIDPEDLYGLDAPYEVELTWSETAPDRYDAIFRHRAAPTAPCHCAEEVRVRRAWAAYTNRRATSSAPADLAVALKDLAREHLPDYMVPSAVLLVDALPRTPNGKLDRKALPEPGRAATCTAAAYVAPTTELEQAISAVWQDLLHLERVGTNDNFFDLGANSLLMVQANSRLRTALRRELSLVDLFRYPSVSALAKHLGTDGNDGAVLQQSQERGRARLGALQRRRTPPAANPAHR